ncbi:LAFE_0G11540g1_1 [Lachancea fermentati]|uniref:LAFE_0G11540g1_1 n=1 Tax=Lachancea fermentati TaxID=4955 RepID=A0A1G4MHU1_LACFM|nr:LAFE_0G11540g1_1 [Lachancea fermentati]
MNQIKSIQKLSLKELECGILKPEASWHEQYKDQAYIYFGGMNLKLTEGDILTIFSQYGIPVDIKLVRDRETGESKGFGFLKYEDQRSTILAVDNLNGSSIAGRVVKVDHTLYTPRDEDKDYTEAVKEELKKDRVPKHISETTIQGASRITMNDEDFSDPMAGFLKSA